MFSKRTKPCEIATTGKVYTKMLSVGCALARIVSHVRSLETNSTHLCYQSYFPMLLKGSLLISLVPSSVSSSIYLNGRKPSP